jgi:sulfur transfer complex TusBCD TusB component (DsrH family)
MSHQQPTTKLVSNAMNEEREELFLRKEGANTAVSAANLWGELSLSDLNATLKKDFDAKGLQQVLKKEFKEFKKAEETNHLLVSNITAARRTAVLTDIKGAEIRVVSLF